MASWVLIDDNQEEATSFAARLSDGKALSIGYMSAKEALAKLDAGTFAPAGVLMDVDLSNEMGRQQTGPGMSQDMRVAQVKQAIPPFPIVRFSLRDKVLQNIGRDSSSDDLFDLKIDKDGLSAEQPRSVARSRLVGVRQIYDSLKDNANLLALLGLDEDFWLRWGSTAFQSDFELGDRVHLKANPLIRMMVHPGLLIDEDILSFRLGIDTTASDGWAALKEQLAAYLYRGVSCDCFSRWWARGIEEWWQEKFDAGAPLAGSSIAQRIGQLSKHVEGLSPLEMPGGSLGDRPWRYCLLTKEQRHEVIPVDPSKAVKIRPRNAMPSWLDPLHAALGIALKNRDDPRVDQNDLKRLHLLSRPKS